MNCDRTIEYRNLIEFGGYGYEKCRCKAKFIATFKDPINGKAKSELLCGRHLNALKKNLDSLNKRTGFDVELKIEKI